MKGREEGRDLTIDIVSYWIPLVPQQPRSRGWALLFSGPIYDLTQCLSDLWWKRKGGAKRESQNNKDLCGVSHFMHVPFFQESKLIEEGDEGGFTWEEVWEENERGGNTLGERRQLLIWGGDLLHQSQSREVHLDHWRCWEGCKSELLVDSSSHIDAAQQHESHAIPGHILA